MSDTELSSEKSGVKRYHSSTSDESDTSFYLTPNSKQEKKRLNITKEKAVDSSKMALESTLDKLNKRLDTLATKEDFVSMKKEIQQLTQTFMDKIEKLEGRVFDMEVKTEKAETERRAIKKSNESLKNTIRQQEQKLRQFEKEQNDLQQYSRRWNLRVYRVPEERSESTEDCVEKVCKIFTDIIGIRTAAEDIEVAHRAGQRSGRGARAILVRFFDRKKRDSILSDRRKLKNKGYVVDEDLTFANYQLSKKAREHSATMSVWSSYGKILAKVKNGRVVRLTIHTDLDEAFRRAMSPIDISLDEEVV